MSDFVAGSGGWFIVPRALFDPGGPLHPMQTGEKACVAFAYADLVSQARWRDGNGLKRGQARVAERFLAKRWRWPRSRVQRCLEDLENRGLIQREHGRGSEPGLITIVGYHGLQASPSNREQVHGLNPELIRKLSRDDAGTKPESAEWRTTSRSEDRAGSRSTNGSKEEVRRTPAYRGYSDYARETRETDTKLCPECGYRRIALDHDLCDRCARNRAEVAAAFPESPSAFPDEDPDDVEAIERQAIREFM